MSYLAPSEFVDLMEYLGAQTQDVTPTEAK